MEISNQTTSAQAATQHFQSGYACSQAVLATFAPDLGMPHDLAMKIASGFAGGMRMGGMCGAVTGAFMVIGLRYAGDECHTKEARAGVYERILEFARRFNERNGSLVCRELLGCDISTPEGMAEVNERNLHATRCVKLIEDAAAILENMAQE